MFDKYCLFAHAKNCSKHPELLNKNKNKNIHFDLIICL